MTAKSYTNFYLKTPTPGIEPGNPEGKRFSRPSEYHCRMWAHLRLLNIAYKFLEIRRTPAVTN